MSKSNLIRLLATLLLNVIQRLFDNYVYNICLSQKSFILRSMRDKYLQNIPCEATVWPHFKGVDCERKSVPAVAVSQPLAAAPIDVHKIHINEVISK